ncbi:MAG TPA: cation-translocating P-type ATPase C-terminal domain-containing protein, partial [Gemmatimonadaceae bacterium]
GVDPAEDDLMRQPPRPNGEPVITSEMWRGIFFTGVVMAGATLFVLDASLPGGFIEGNGDIRYAQTMAFMTLTLAQLFNVFNSRSDRRSAFARLFSNHWLWTAIGFSLALQLLVLYLPAMQHAFGTVRLTAGDWLRCLGAASTILVMRELSKIFLRRAQRRGSNI